MTGLKMRLSIASLLFMRVRVIKEIAGPRSPVSLSISVLIF